MDKRGKKEKKAREDQALNRVLLWFGGAVVLEFLILLLNRFYVNFDARGTGLAYGLAVFLRGLVWLALAAALGCGVWALLRRRAGRSCFVPVALTIVWAALGSCALVATLWRAVGIQFLYVVVPGVAVLALIYYLYQHEFFCLGLLGGLGLFALWSYRKLILTQPMAVYVIFALVGALTLAAAGAIFWLQRRKGLLGGARVFSPKANYALLYLGCLVNAIALAAALAGGLGMAYVLLILVVGWLFAAAIYYTVRLM